MKKEELIIAVDIETHDPMIKKGQGFMYKDFKMLDIGVFHYNQSSSFYKTFQDITSFSSYLKELSRENNIKILFHNALYDLPILIHLGFDYKNYTYTDTMLLFFLSEPLAESLSLAYLSKALNLKYGKLSDKDFFESIKKERVENTISVLEELGITEQTIKLKMEMVRSIAPKSYYYYLEYDLKSTMEAYIKLNKRIAKLASLEKSSWQKYDLNSVRETMEKMIPIICEINLRPLPVNKEDVEESLHKLEDKIHDIFSGYAPILERFPYILEGDELFKKRSKKLENLNLFEQDAKDVFFKKSYQRIEDLMSLYPLFNEYFLKQKEIIKELEEGRISWKVFKENPLFSDKTNPSTKGFKELFEMYFTTADARLLSESNGKISFSKASKKILAKANKTEQASFLLEYLDKIVALNKAKTSNLEPYLDKINDLGALYTSISVYRSEAGGGAVTGRASSRNINIQQLPRAENDPAGIKALFKAPKGYKLLEVDYSSQEFRIFGIIANASFIIDAFKKDVKADFHASTAKLVFGTHAEATSPDDIAVEVDGVIKYVSKKHRSNAKSVNFGIVYGMLTDTLAEQLQITKEESVALVEAITKEIPEFKTLYEEVMKQAVKGEITTNIFGRIMKPEYLSYTKTFIDEYTTFIDKLELGRKLDYFEVNNHFKKTIDDIYFDLVYSYSKDEVTYQEFFDKFKAINPKAFSKLSIALFEKMYDSLNSNDPDYSKYPLNKLYQSQIFLMNSTKANSKNFHIKNLILLETRFRSNNYKPTDYQKKIKKCLNDYQAGDKRNVVSRIGSGDKNGMADFLTNNISYMVYSWCKNRYNYLKKMVNFICQSSGADILYRAVVELDEKNYFSCDAKIMAMVHDSLVFIVKEEQVDFFVEKLKEVMEIKYLSIPMSVDCTISDVWGK